MTHRLLAVAIAVALLAVATVAGAQPPSEPTAPAGPPPTAAPAAADEPAPPPAAPAPDAAKPPIAPDRPAPPTCRLATQPEQPKEGDDPAKRKPTFHSPMRQVCEDELAKDDDWWFNLQGRLRNNIHEQAAREITTNNKHVVAAYGAMWMIAVGFLVFLWMRQQRLKAEVVRLGEELARVEEADRRAAAARAGTGSSDGADA